jgi:hypothetical protein
MSYIAELHKIWDQFMQDLRAGYFDSEPEEEQEDEEVEDGRLEQTVRDYNDAINDVGSY